MHELSITESVVTAVSNHVGPDAKVTAVTLEIGKLSGVVGDSVRFCFELCAQGTPLDGARLDIIDVPGQAHCRQCLTDVVIDDFIPLCTCGSADLEIFAGQELKITQVEVV